MVNIKGIDKAELLVGLYNNSHVQGMGYLDAIDEPLTVERARKILKETQNFDYLYGRVLKVNLSSDEEFDEWLYDRDNGAGAAQRVVDEIRKKNEDYDRDEIYIDPIEKEKWINKGKGTPDELEGVLDDINMENYMFDHIGEEYDAIVSGVTSSGLFVQLPNKVEGLLKFKDMPGDIYEVDENNTFAIGKNSKEIYRVGSLIHVRIMGHNDIFDKRVYFEQIKTNYKDNDDKIRKGQTKLNYDFLEKKYNEIQNILLASGKEGFTRDEINKRIKVYLIKKLNPMDTAYLVLEDDIIDMFKYVLYNEIAKRFQEGSLIFDPTLPDSNLDEMWEENMEAIHGRLSNLQIEEPTDEFLAVDHYSKVKGLLIEPRTNQVDMDDGNSLPFIPPTESTIGRKP